MLDPGLADRRSRRGALAGLAALVVLGHGLLLGEIDPLRLGADPVGAPLSVRTIAAAAPEVAATPAAALLEAPAAVPEAPEVAALPAPPRRERRREPVADAAIEPLPAAASAPEPVAPVAVVVAAAPPAPVPEPSASAVATAGLDSDAPGSAPAASQPLLAAGEQPPPVYRTRLPPAATLHYQVRTNVFRGNGEIRWRLNAEAYSLELEARIAGVTLLRMASDGAVDAAGLAPRRFVDQRVRRAAQAANFQREAGKVSYSGRSIEHPLLAGTQDQLSWMIQLAGIVSADPALLTEGSRITMVVVGARGEARVWTLRSAGPEGVETRAGAVAATKFVREGAGPYERGYEVWLDPERGYLPAHMTQRNAAGESVFDLLLDRVEPVP